VAFKSSLVNTWLTAATTIGYRDPLSSMFLAIHSTMRTLTFSTTAGDLGAVVQSSSIIILDGVERAASRIIFVRIKSLCKMCRVIAISRNTPPNELAPYFRLLPLRQLDQRESEFLLGLTDSDAHSKRTLLDRLGGHPLALIHAGAALRGHADVNAYVRRLDEALGGKVAPTIDFRECMETVLREIAGSPTGERDLELLYILSAANEPTPMERIRSLLKRRELAATPAGIVKEAENQIEDAIRLLEQRGLVSMNGEMIDMHRLIRQYFRERQRK
jgi:hypothetical protein